MKKGRHCVWFCNTAYSRLHDAHQPALFSYTLPSMLTGVPNSRLKRIVSKPSAKLKHIRDGIMEFVMQAYSAELVSSEVLASNILHYFSPCRLGIG
jgi:hypothetical protein